MMPIALGYGAGGEARAPMGWTVAAGMFTASALTLLVIPVVYTLVDDFTSWLQRDPFGSLQLLFYTIMVGLGAWVAYLPFLLSITGPVFWAMTLGGGVLAILAVTIMVTDPASSVGLSLYGILLTFLGISLAVRPAEFSHYLVGLDIVRTGYTLTALGLVALVLLLISRFRRNREVE
jgi:hypothetical protein